MGSRYEIRYTEGFKEKVVGEVLSGVYSLCRAQKVYGIGGNSTIQKWIKKMEGKTKGAKRVVVVQTSQEVEAVVQMERRARQLEKIIADQAFELKVWKELLKRTQVYVDEETKKKCVENLSEEARKCLESA